MELNYYNTFIKVATDCPVERGVVPPDKKSGKTRPGIEFELASAHPYAYTQEDLLFLTHVRHKGVPEEEVAARESDMRQEFFAKPMACLRASMLPKKSGWGIHFNAEGKLAIYPMESPEYRAFVDGEGGDVKVLPAMRSSRA